MIIGLLAPFGIIAIGWNYIVVVCMESRVVIGGSIGVPVKFCLGKSASIVAWTII